MEFKSVNVCGLDRIYNALMNIGNNQLSEGMDVLLNHISVSFLIKDINALELIFLKEFCTDVKVISQNLPYTDNSFDNLEDTVKNLRKLSDQIVSDMDVSEDSNPYNAIPLYMVKYKVIATFKGMNITSITGSIFKRLFINKEAKEGEPPYYSEYPEDEMENILIRKFMTEFYRYMSDKLSTIDIASQFQLHHNFFNIIKSSNNNIALSHINTFGGDINFTNNTPEKLNSSINKIKLFNVKNKSLNTIDNSYYYFTVKSTLSTYIVFKCIVDYVCSSENIQPLKEIDVCNIADDIRIKYQNRILELISDILTYRSELDDKDIHKYMILLSGQYIMYNIKVPATFDIEEFRTKVGRIQMVDSEIESIIGSINNIINNMNSVLTKN